jgi:hypothetical protein
MMELERLPEPTRTARGSSSPISQERHTLRATNEYGWIQVCSRNADFTLMETRSVLLGTSESDCRSGPDSGE